MDIIFIDAFQQSSKIHFPIGINLLSTIINTNSKYTSEVISFPNLIAEEKVPNNVLLEKGYETIVSYILNRNPKIISFYTVGDSYFISLIVAENIKRINKDIKIIFAGPHVSLCSYETLKNFDFIDMVAIGEGEQNILSVLDYFNDRENIENIKGICYRKLDQIAYNESMLLLKNLDELPMIEINEDAIPITIPIESGRGCPYNCTFCCTKTFWKRKVRLKSTDRIIDEVKYYLSKYNIKKFDFIHDLFTANKKSILEFCNRLLDLGINLEWTCSARADTLDEETISIMSKAGCKKILLGIETGSERMQGEINKHLKIDEVRETIETLNRYKIEIQANFIYGFPKENEEDLIKTLDLVRFCVEEMQILETTIHKCSCYPGTHIYMTYRDKLILNEDAFYLFRYPAKNQVDFIKSYANLLSNLFILDGMLFDRYFYLDIFINYIYNYFAFKTPNTMKEILESYNNNLLDFYCEYEEKTKETALLLTRTVYYEDKLSDVRAAMSASLELFIKNKVKDDFIVDLYRFEEETFKAVSMENRTEPKVLTFDYDMLLYYQKHMKRREKCKLVFYVTKDQEVKVYREE